MFVTYVHPGEMVTIACSLEYARFLVDSGRVHMGVYHDAFQTYYL